MKDEPGQTPNELNDTFAAHIPKRLHESYKARMWEIIEESKGKLRHRDFVIEMIEDWLAKHKHVGHVG